MADRRPLVLINGAVAECPNNDRLVHNGVIQGTQLNATNGVVVAGGVITMGNLGLCVNLNANYLQGQPASAFAAASHTHTAAQISDFATAVDARAAAFSGIGPLADIPKSNLAVGHFYRPTNGRLAKVWNGTKWQHVSPQNLPWEDGQIHLSAPNYDWQATSGNEFKCVAMNGGPSGLSQPGSVFINGTEATLGTVGSLAAGQWGWDGSTVHVRLSDGANPNTKEYAHVIADPLAWIGGRGTATAQIVSGVPLMTMPSTGGTPTIRARMRPVSGSWVYYCSPLPVHGLTGENGVGVAVSDGTKFEALVALRNSTSGLLEIQLVRFDTNTTGRTNVITAIPLANVLTGGNLMLAYSDNGTTTRGAFVGGFRDFAFNVNPGMSRTAHLTAGYVGPCVMSVDGAARAWFPETTF